MCVRVGTATVPAHAPHRRLRLTHTTRLNVGQPTWKRVAGTQVQHLRIQETDLYDDGVEALASSLLRGMVLLKSLTLTTVLLADAGTVRGRSTVGQGQGRVGRDSSKAGFRLLWELSNRQGFGKVPN